MLKDGFGRNFDYLRVSVTDKCNLRCVYCIPPEGVELLDHHEVLRNEEFVQLIAIFADLGIRKVRFTGGEPLVRKGIMEILHATREKLPGLEICLTTNGVLLADRLEELHDIGVRKLNISLDTLSRERYREITGNDALNATLASIDRALDIGGFDVKINAVLFQETIDEIEQMLDYFSERTCQIRFIERMPFGGGSVFYPAGSLLSVLKTMGKLERDSRIDTRVAEMYTLAYKERRPLSVGIIPTMTHKFCAQCNRLRITCNGLLKTCLHSTSEYDLKKLYRINVGAEVIKREIMKAVMEKPREHHLECNINSSEGCASLLSRRSMSRIGG